MLKKDVKRVVFSCPDELLNIIDDYAKSRYTSRASAIVYLLCTSLDSYRYTYEVSKLLYSSSFDDVEE